MAVLSVLFLFSGAVHERSNVEACFLKHEHEHVTLCINVTNPSSHPCEQAKMNESASSIVFNLAKNKDYNNPSLFTPHPPPYSLESTCVDRVVECRSTPRRKSKSNHNKLDILQHPVTTERDIPSSSDMYPSKKSMVRKRSFSDAS
jgi:hypothetical protein